MPRPYIKPRGLAKKEIRERRTKSLEKKRAKLSRRPALCAKEDKVNE